MFNISAVKISTGFTHIYILVLVALILIDTILQMTKSYSTISHSSFPKDPEAVGLDFCSTLSNVTPPTDKLALPPITLLQPPLTWWGMQL